MGETRVNDDDNVDKEGQLNFHQVILVIEETRWSVDPREMSVLIVNLVYREFSRGCSGNLNTPLYFLFDNKIRLLQWNEIRKCFNLKNGFFY